MNDAFGRQVDYMRISVTDRCNERCSYCMPESFSDWLPREQILSYEEILHIARVATTLGFSRFRVTGGEPLVRRDIVPFVERLAALPGVRTVSMTTNGTRLAPLAKSLCQAGLTSLNISLDSLDADGYRRITRGNLHEALAGIEAATEASFESIKLNVVLMRSGNEDQLWPIVCYAAKLGLKAVRFIELMPISDPSMTDQDHFLPHGEAINILRQYDELSPMADAKLGSGPAKYWRLQKLGMTVGFIGALTDEHFCERCNKVRLTADGFIRPCLGNHGELDMKPALREIGTDEAVAGILQQALREKPLEHVFRDNQYTPLRIMTAIGG